MKCSLAAFLSPPYKPLEIGEVCEKESLSTRLWATDRVKAHSMVYFAKLELWFHCNYT